MFIFNVFKFIADMSTPTTHVTHCMSVYVLILVWVLVVCVGLDTTALKDLNNHSHVLVACTVKHQDWQCLQVCMYVSLFVCVRVLVVYVGLDTTALKDLNNHSHVLAACTVKHQAWQCLQVCCIGNTKNCEEICWLYIDTCPNSCTYKLVYISIVSTLFINTSCQDDLLMTLWKM